MNSDKLRNNEIIKKLESQFRKTSRRLIQLETEEETLHYLVESFIQHIVCDFVGIILINNDQYEARIWAGHHDELVRGFPLDVSACSELLMVTSLYKNEYATKETCDLHKTMEDADMETWFTVPLVHEDNRYGFCLIGYKRPMELLKMEHVFNEFGKDVALSIKLMREKKEYTSLVDGLTWITNHLSPNSSISNMVRKLTKRAATTTRSDFAAVYLYNEGNETYDLHPSIFGDMQIPSRIKFENKSKIVSNFEQIGGDDLAVSIQLGNQTYGLLYIARENQKARPYGNAELNLAQLIGHHFGMIIMHAINIKNEREQKERLKKLLQYQQQLVKETIVQDDFESITKMIFDIYERPVILFDRFLRVLSVHGIEEEKLLSNFVDEMNQHIFAKTVFQLYLKEEQVFSIWPISGGLRERIGYLAIGVNEQSFDEFDQLTIEVVSNISSIQFIKKKLVYDANEQMKDTFIAKLLTTPIDEEKIIEYASVLNWDIYTPHRIAHLHIQLEQIAEADLWTIQTEKRHIWEQLNIDLLTEFPNILMSTYNDQFLFIVPTKYEENTEFWGRLHEKVYQVVSKLEKKAHFGIGIGKIVEELTEYYTSYQQAIEAANVLKSRFTDRPYIFFEQLGSYMILHHLDDNMSKLFVHEQLEKLIEYENEKKIELWQTLKVFLLNNGNVKGTADQLFLHRSTLIYRLQKIEELLSRDLNDADVRFDLMMAIKLLEMKEKLKEINSI